MKLGVAGAGRIDFNNPTGTRGLVAVDKVGGKVRLYEPGTYREMAAIEVEKLPHEVAISPDHQTAYVTIYGSGIFGGNPNPAQTIAVIDLIRREQVDQISVAPYFAPHGIMVGQDGKLWVSCDASAKLIVVNPHTRAVEEAFDTGSFGSHWITLTPDGAKVYISNKTDSVGVFDVATRTLAADHHSAERQAGHRGCGWLRPTAPACWWWTISTHVSTSSIRRPTRSSTPSRSPGTRRPTRSAAATCGFGIRSTAATC